jgi:NAD(P)-dependent dehydrogenase (short-subunit alcohol dehydrogenase family)
VLLIATDVSKREDCKALIDQTVAHFKAIDVLFLNAGVGQACQISKITDPEVMEQVRRSWDGLDWSSYVFLLFFICFISFLSF